MKETIKCQYTMLLEPSELREHPQNPNYHPEKQVEILAKIIKANGFRRPIVVSERTGEKVIIKGHGRFMASKLLGMTEVPVDIQQYDSEKEELEDLVADNRISELADVDNKKLYEILKESEGKFETGYTEGEIEAIVANIEIKEEDLTVEREVDEDPKEASGQKSIILHYTSEEAEELQIILNQLQKILNCRNTSSTILTLLKNNHQ
jgi:ParB-like chromosome segregation protein Spo0J